MKLISCNFYEKDEDKNDVISESVINDAYQYKNPLDSHANKIAGLITRKRYKGSNFIVSTNFKNKKVVDVLMFRNEYSHYSLMDDVILISKIAEYPCDRFNITIFQPNVYPTEQVMLVSAEQVRNLARVIKEKTNLLDPTVCHLCSSCSVQTDCDAFKSYFGDKVREFEPKLKGLENEKTLTELELADMLNLEKMFKNAFIRVREEVKRRIRTGKPVKGWILKAGRKSKIWTIKDYEIIDFLGDDALLEKVISPSQALKLQLPVSKKERLLSFIELKLGAEQLVEGALDDNASFADIAALETAEEF